MQPNSNWQSNDNSGYDSNQPRYQYPGQTLQDIENQVQSSERIQTEHLEDRRVPNITIDPASMYHINGQETQPSEIVNEAYEEVYWEAKEYITADKNTQWYIGLGVVVVVVVLLDIFFMQSITVSILMVVIAIVLVVMTVRPPEIIQYKIDKDGVYVSNKRFNFTDYKAFGMYKENGHDSIMLVPVKRFMPAMSIYFPAEKGPAIVALLTKKLPSYEVKLDFMDRIVRMLRIY